MKFAAHKKEPHAGIPSESRNPRLPNSVVDSMNLPCARISLFLLPLFLLVPFLAPVAAQKPAFAVATIRPTRESVKFEHDGNTELVGNTLRMQDVTVATCLKLAYHIQDRQIAGPEIGLPASGLQDDLQDTRHNRQSTTAAAVTKCSGLNTTQPNRFGAA